MRVPGPGAPNEQHVAAARKRFGAALAEWRRASVAMLLADDVVVVLPGDSVAGRAAVATFLLTPEGPLPFTAPPTFGDVCSGGARDVGMIATRDGHVYAYTIDWRDGADGARVAALRLREAPPGLAALRIACAGEWPPVGFSQRRIEVFALVSAEGLAASTNVHDLERAMEAQGWAPQYCDPTASPGTCPSSPYAPYRQRGMSAVIGLELRPRSRLGVEFLGGRLARAITAEHSPQSFYVVDRAAREPWIVATLATVGRGLLHAGAGPAMELDRWHWGQTERFSGRFTDRLETWSSAAPGVVMEGSIALPLAPGGALQLRLQQGWFARQRVRAFDGLNEMRVRGGYRLLGIAIALRY